MHCQHTVEREYTCQRLSSVFSVRVEREREVDDMIHVHGGERKRSAYFIFLEQVGMHIIYVMCIFYTILSMQ